MIDTIKRSERFAILAHKKPDIDAASSAMAIFYFLLAIGKKRENIDIIFPKHIAKISELGGSILKRKSSLNNYDLTFIVDCNGFSRVSGLEYVENFDPEKCILFDHHEVSDEQIPSKFAIIDGTSASCTCVLYKYFMNFLKDTPYRDAFITCIVRGLLSDTRFLENVNDEGKDVINICRQYVDVEYISLNLKNVDQRTQELISIANQRFSFIGTIGCSYILQEDLQPCERGLDEIDHKIIIEGLPSCETLIFLMQNINGSFKGSIRTKIASLETDAFCIYMKSKNIFLTGGGHQHYSAGFTTNCGDVNHILSIVSNELANFKTL